jgi:hypothetical protein
MNYLVEEPLRTLLYLPEMRTESIDRVKDNYLTNLESVKKKNERQQTAYIR